MPQKYVNVAAGLHTFKNELTSPDGAQVIANNVVIDRDNTIESRRGFNLYLPFGVLESRAKQLLQYKDRILAHYDDKLLFDTPNAGFDPFAGTYEETEAGLRIKGIEASGNFYFTTSDGIRKISARRGDQLSSQSGYITNAGAVRAINFTVDPDYSQNGFFQPNSHVAYRILWGYNDINENLILGYPSDAVVVNNVDLRESCVTRLKIYIPTEITTSSNSQNYFYQIYRSNQKTLDLGVDYEFKLVHEDFPTTGVGGELDLGYIDGFIELIPDDFRRGGVDLYTNQISGEGDGQANARPPLAKDICLFRDSVFFSNTKTSHFMNLSMISPDNFTPNQTKFYVASEDGVQTYTFRGVREESSVDFNLLADIDISTLDKKYFLLNAANNTRKYFVWFDNVGSNEVQKITFTPTPTDGNFSLNLFGTQTKDFDKNVTAAQIEEELNKIVDFVVVTGNSATGFYIEFNGELALQDVPLMSAISNLTDGTNSVTVTIVTDKVAQDETPANVEVVGRIPIRVDIKGTTTKVQLLTQINSVFLDIIDFEGTVVSNKFEIENTESGECDDISNSATSPLPGTVVIQKVVDGIGEDSPNYFLLSSDPSQGQRLEQTTRSMVRIINSNPNEFITAYYTSLENDIPGQLLFESKTPSDVPFYVAVNDDLGSSFNPSIPSVANFSATINTSEEELIITWTGHNLSVGSKVVLFNPQGATFVDEDINGVFEVIRVDGVNTIVVSFIPAAIDPNGTITAFKTTQVSNNEVKPNRIYFSKTGIPEAVPLLNFFDVGSKDSEIKRIVPLRDSLFVLKDEGIFRLSGSNAANFSVSLFDSSSPIIAADSVAVLNNQIYMLSTQGIVAVSDGGVDIISRNIEDLVITPTSNNYPDFSTQAFGIASESDRSYLIFLPTQIDDETATQAFRYNIFTKAWTRWTMAKTCGIVKKRDDKIYFGAADINYVEQERKNFLRSDFADRQYEKEILGVYNNNRIELSNVFDVSRFDAIYQEQFISIARFNRLLATLDSDTFLDSDYESTLLAEVGTDMATKLTQLIIKIEADDDSITRPPYTPYSGSNDITEIRDGFNTLVDELNVSDRVFLSSYVKYDTKVLYEGAINEVSVYTNSITLLTEIPFVAGNCIVFEFIDSFIEYSPEVLNDASLGKHFSECSLLFDQFNFTFGTMGFRTDVYAERIETLFVGEGSGDYGTQVYGEKIYGGLANDRPFRTYVPRNYQRCRYITLSFRHNLARESFKLIGYSVTYKGDTTQRFYKR